MKKKNKTKKQSALKVEYRNQPYYGNYEYKVVIPIPNIHRLRYHDSYNDYLTYTTYSYWGSYGQANKELDNKDEINRYFAWKDSISDTTDQKLRLEGGKISVFSNDLSYLEDVVKKIDPDNKTDVEYRQVSSPTEPDIMYFSKPPKHNYRIYFKSVMVDKATRESIARFVNDNTDSGVEVSPTLNRWLINAPSYNKDGTSYLREGSFIDYDEESYEMAVRLMFGELLKSRVKKLLQRPK